MTTKRYQETHPWISFVYQSDISPLWASLGEAFSTSQHMAGTPLQPALAADLSRVYLVKGAVATTAIEGNTLSEDEMNSLLAGTTSLPPSQQYLEQEVSNVLHGLNIIMREVGSGQRFDLSVQWIKDQNALILDRLEVEDHVVPGEFTKTQLVVGNAYRAAPPEDVDYLMERLVRWIEDWIAPCRDESVQPQTRFYQAFFAATLAHLYIAWIHPFGDGNGRTARLLECAILAHCGGVPWISSNLLSDHYNRTRSRYYQRLSAASRAGDVAGFLRYAAEGYVDMLREQIKQVQAMQRRVAWTNYVHEALHSETTGRTKDRRRDLALALPESPAKSRREIRQLDTNLAMLYAGKEDKTMTRDLNKLLELKLIRREANGRYSSHIGIIDAFKPFAGSELTK